MIRVLVCIALLAPLAVPQQASLPPGGLNTTPPPSFGGSGILYDPVAPGTWGLPMVGGYG